MKKTHSLISAFVSVALAFAVAGCQIDSDRHEHSFSKDWTSNATDHWHAATCEHTKEVSDKAAHTFGEWKTTVEATEETEGKKERSCSVCLYKEEQSLAKLDHTHKFSSDWTSNATDHWHAATCEHTKEVSDKTAHTFGEWKTTVEATEETEGKKERICSVCLYKEEQSLAKLDHTHKFSSDWTSDATDHWHKCSGCKEVSGKAVHTFGEWTVIKEATEEAEGSKERSCSVCGYTATEAIEKLAHTHKFATDWTKDETYHWYASTCGHTTEVSGKAKHTFGDWTVIKEATEEAEGKQERKCTVCPYTATEAIEKLAHTHKFATAWTKDETNHWHAATCEHTTEVSGKAAHTFGDWTVTKAATCTEKGSRKRTCSVCKYEATEDISAKGHAYSEAWTSNATDHWHAATCGHTKEVSDKTAHTFGEWETTVEATEKTEGKKERICSVCSYKEEQSIAKLDHTHKFSSDWTSNATDHWHNCSGCEEVRDKAAHSFGDWTVTKEATEEAEGSRERSCTVCGYTATEAIEKLAHTHKFATAWTKDETNHWHAATCEHTTEVSGKAAHTFGDWTVTKAATCTKKGSRKHTCSVCKYEVTEDISAKGHAYSENWTSDATDHWHAATCGHAEEVSGKTAHTFGEWTVTKAATCTEKGSRKHTCSVCKYEATEDISAKGHAYSEDWTSDATDHWHAATCGHTTEVSGKAAHSFGDWIVTKAATKEAKGSKERVCTVCNYKEVVDIAKIPENFVLIPAGTFQMGSNEGYDRNKPVHEVTITKSFYMGKYEVTQAEYEQYCSYGSSSPNLGYGVGDNYPAYYVSWYDALVYCNKRSMAEGLTPCYSISGSTDPEKWGTVPTSSNNTWNAVVCNWNANGYRLPTEAEWEYAARAEDNTVASLTYSGTSDVNKLGEYAWYSSNSNSKTHEVGTKKANGFGLYDMSGNVWEWCWNWFTNSSYDAEAEGGSDPTGASSGWNRVFRGSSWYGDSVDCAVSYRYSNDLYGRYGDLGFRVVRPSSN